MMEIFICSARIYFFLLFFSTLAYGSDSANTCKIHNDTEELYLEMCTAAGCNKKSLPDVADFYFESPSYSLNDLDSDAIPELIVTEEYAGSVNIRSVFFRINDADEFETIKTNGADKGMYNVTFHDGKIISSYRDAGSWFDDIYNYRNGVFTLEMRDKNGEIRTFFNGDGEVIDSVIVKDEDRYWFEREVVTGIIKLRRAVLYNSPNLQDISKMYLVNGDLVTLKNFYDLKNENIRLYLIEYINASNRKIIMWVSEEALMIDL